MAGPLCQIVLDNQWNTFYGGSVITGHVKINLLKEKKVRGESYAAVSVFEIISDIFRIENHLGFRRKKKIVIINC